MDTAAVGLGHYDFKEIESYPESQTYQLIKSIEWYKMLASK